MLCVRCSHPLPPRADRCLRCFALNPSGGPGMLPQPAQERPQPSRANLSIESDPPAAPFAMSFEDDDPPQAVTLPDPRPAPRVASEPVCMTAPPVLSEPELVATPHPAFDRLDAFMVEPEVSSEPEPAPAPDPGQARAPEPAKPPERDRAPAPARAPARPRARLALAWLLDALCIAALTACCIALALRQGRIQYPLDFLRDTAPLWGALVAAIAIAWSWTFTTLTARSPGMALAGLRLRSVHGGSPTPTEALARALFALPSAALGFSGFALALFDRRRQTLHDKLCRCVTVID